MAAPLTCLGFGLNIQVHRWIRFAATATFGIYVSHVLIAKALTKVADPAAWPDLVHAAVVWSPSFALVLALRGSGLGARDSGLGTRGSGLGARVAGVAHPAAPGRQETARRRLTRTAARAILPPRDARSRPTAAAGPAGDLDPGPSCARARSSAAPLLATRRCHDAARAAADHLRC